MCSFGLCRSCCVVDDDAAGVVQSDEGVGIGTGFWLDVGGIYTPLPRSAANGAEGGESLRNRERNRGDKNHKRLLLLVTT